MKLIALIFFLFSTLFLQANEKIPFFIPPDKWTVSNPKTYSKHIKVAFTKKEKSPMRASLNLAMQKTDLSLDAYILQAKKLHEKDTNTKYTIIGTIDIKDGKANLSEIDKKIHSQNYKMLQMIFVKDKTAYVMTAASKKNNFLENSQNFIKAFKSFELIDDPFSLITDSEKAKNLKQKYRDTTEGREKLNEKQIKKNLLTFEKYLDKNFQNLGQYFIILLTQKAYKKIKEF
ncbi:MAG: hypothetical protein KR126chlam6_01520 [Candidatus Anoxychlamydiales bacterium]|nr:hypothetical protein [Candidatus Anoxychlamydiales bacterium]